MALLVLLVSSHLFSLRLLQLQSPPPSSDTLGILVLPMRLTPRNSSRTTFRATSHRNSVQIYLSKEVPLVEGSPSV